MTVSQRQEKNAVECGYWHLYRFNPSLAAEGKNPFVLDSKEPKGDFRAFLKSEVRYGTLYKKFDKDFVDKIFEQAEKHAEERYQSYVRMAKAYDTAEA
jgi:pyruvate-ferredoxin/flavodoxin oxidoreductase